MIRHCIICGKEFKCSPSDKKITCSNECRRKRISDIAKGKPHPWSDDAKKRLSKKGQTENLKLGTEQAKKSLKAGRFETNVNAKDWHLISPSGKHYKFHSLNFWLRENCEELFGCLPDSKQFKNTRSGLAGAKRAMLGGTYTCTTYKGWQVIPTEEEIKKAKHSKEDR